VSDPAERIGRARPRLGIVLGSGLGAVAARIDASDIVPYAELDGFPRPQIAGHAGRLLLGRLGGLPVACLEGRAHYYESGSAAAMMEPIRALRRAGIEMLLLTNAAGSLRAEIPPGRLMAIADHINLIPGSPLAGPNDNAVGPRFPSLRGAYDPELRRHLHRAAAQERITLSEGVYLAYPGPHFETPAEIRAFRALGADAVGMSTAPETIIARHCGLRVAAVSVVANLAEGLGGESPSHAQTLEVARRASGDLARLVEVLCRGLAAGG
jgi:xanthosine phosphorylase